MTSRVAKNNAMKALQNSVENDEEVSLDENCLNKYSNIVENVAILDIPNVEKIFTTPRVTQNASMGQTLDLIKQYKRKTEFCDRDLIRIHNRAVNKKDNGSQNKGLIYVDFQAGMFEALKVNFMKSVENDFEYEIKPIAAPKVELYGQAEERICLDLSMKVQGTEHDVKIKVYNTRCSLDVQGFHDDYSKRFDHLQNLTVGEFFAEHIITKVVEKISKNVDIIKLNDYIRSLATEGKKAAKARAVKKH